MRLGKSIEELRNEIERSRERVADANDRMITAREARIKRHYREVEFQFRLDNPSSTASDDKIFEAFLDDFLRRLEFKSLTGIELALSKDEQQIISVEIQRQIAAKEGFKPIPPVEKNVRLLLVRFAKAVLG